jgi:hypothetical protein
VPSGTGCVPDGSKMPEARRCFHWYQFVFVVEVEEQARGPARTRETSDLVKDLL